MLDYSVLISPARSGDGDRAADTEEALARLALMLDEWPALIKSVNNVLRGPPDGMVSALRSLRHVLTKLPDMAAGGPDSASQAGPDTGSVAQVRLSGCRRSGRCCTRPARPFDTPPLHTPGIANATVACMRNRVFAPAFTARIHIVCVKEQSHAARRQICLHRQAKASG